MPMYCDNQTTIYITNNPTFHERTKHIEVDCHYVREIVMNGIITTPYTKSPNQFADIFTKRLNVRIYEFLCNKLGVINIHAPV